MSPLSFITRPAKKIYFESIVCHFRFDWDVKSNFCHFGENISRTKRTFLLIFFFAIHSLRPFLYIHDLNRSRAATPPTSYDESRSNVNLKFIYFSLDSPRLAFGWEKKVDIFLVISCRCLQKRESWTDIYQRQLTTMVKNLVYKNQERNNINITIHKVVLVFIFK